MTISCWSKVSCDVMQYVFHKVSKLCVKDHHAGWELTPLAREMMEGIIKHLVILGGGGGGGRADSWVPPLLSWKPCTCMYVHVCHLT